MPDKKHESSSFTVTDRRLFTSEGELRQDAPEKDAHQEKETPKPVTPAATPAPAATEKHPEPVQSANVPQEAANPAERDFPVPPTAAEQQAQADAYKQSSQDIDTQVELGGHSAKEFEMTFERFMASLYMTAMLQLGLMRQQNDEPRIDIIGARQTIDTLSLIGEKTKGNLTPVEENFLQNSLYELRMAYVEVTNALTRPPQPGTPQHRPKTGTGGR
jgi:hypothetical protein